MDKMLALFKSKLECLENCMKLQVPEAFQYYDPFNIEHSEGILKHFNVTVDCRPESNGERNWGYIWKYGGVTLAPESKLSEAQCRAIVALAVYLYATGVHPGLDDRLATAYILQGWSRHEETTRQRSSPGGV